LLEKRGIDLSGVQVKEKSFRWGGYYEYDMNEAKTLRTELNCITEFDGALPPAYRDAAYLFLGNLDPDIQLKVMEQMRGPKLVVMDTMNFWITHKKDVLLKAIAKVDVLVFNDGEARQLFATPNLVKAAGEAIKLGPRAVIIKKGEHGSLLFTEKTHFSAGAYPLETIKDPTGCGDTFGGGLIGWLAKTDDTSEKNMRKAVIYGSALASFNAEDFSLNRLKRLTHDEVEARYHAFREMREF
jgi:ribokinase